MKKINFNIFLILATFIGTSVAAQNAGYNVTPNSTNITYPSYLSSPRTVFDNPTISINGATCYGVNTRGNSQLLTGYKEGQTWIRVTMYKNNSEIGKFSYPLEVFHYVPGAKARAGDPVISDSKNYLAGMMAGLNDAGTNNAEKAKLQTLGYEVSAAFQTVRVENIDLDEDDLRSGITFKYERVYTTEVPNYAGGFHVENKGKKLKFNQNATFKPRSDDDNSGAAREQRPIDEVSYNVTAGGSLALTPTLYGDQSSGCKGYTSPLMAFFDKKRPEFRGETRNIFYSASTWVEPGAPGYFLVLDKNKNGKIDSENELFGRQGKGKNGFEILKPYDKNQDKKIDKKDKVFTQLALWNDKNGNGKSEKSELFSLADKGVISIDLNYTSGRIKNFGMRAEAREYSTFTFRDAKTKKLKKGDMIDIWFQTRPGSSRLTASTE